MFNLQFARLLLARARQTRLGSIDCMRYLGSYYCGRLHRRFPVLPCPTFHVHVNCSGRGVTLPVRSNETDYRILSEIFSDDPYVIPGGVPRTVLDLGGNTGYTAAYFSALYPEASVATVEPEPGNVAVIESVKNLNRLDRLQIIQAAVTDRDGTAMFHVAECADSHGLSERASNATIEVKTLSVPSIMRLLGWDYIDVLKIDIEGAEEDVFRDSPAWLSRVGVIVGELHGSYTQSDVARDLDGHGYRMHFDVNKIGKTTFVADRVSVMASRSEALAPTN